MATNIDAVAIKLSVPWTSNMSAWFLQAEAQFNLRKISDSTTKFFHIIQVLSEEMMQKVMHLVSSPPADDPYGALKAELLKATALSDKQRYAAATREVVLGDSKPSELLARLKTLFPSGNPDDSFFRQLFLEKLPPIAQTIIAAAPSTSTTQELAVMADKVVEAHFLQSPIASVQKPTSSTEETLAKQVADLQLAVTNLSAQLNRRDRSNSRHSRSPSRRRLIEPENGKCFYHTNFGENARKCKPPCSGNEVARK